jgi:hypothetical protein
MSDSTFDDWEDNWEANCSDLDIKEDIIDPLPQVPVPVPVPEPVVSTDEKSTKNMEHEEIDSLFSSMAEVFKEKKKKFGLPDDFNLETESDYIVLGEFISSIVKESNNKGHSYMFVRTIIDNTIKTLDEKALLEYSNSFNVEMNSRKKNKKGKKKPKKKQANLRMDRANQDNTGYDDDFGGF